MNASNLTLRIAGRNARPHSATVFSGTVRACAVAAGRSLVGAALAVSLVAPSGALADVKGPDWKSGDREFVVLATGGAFGRNPDMHQQQQTPPEHRDPYSFLTCCSP